ncbi:hypothetical protein HDU91_001715, partial [Kappamyces sp. JEL0680]
YGPVDDKPPSAAHVKLFERECHLKQRLFACFKLLPTSIYESVFTPLVRITVDTFALDPEKPDRFLATLGTRDGTLLGFGGKDTGALVVETVVSTSLVSGSIINVAADSGAEERNIFQREVHDRQLQALEVVLDKTVQKSIENDPHSLYLTSRFDTIETKSGTEGVISGLSPPAPCQVSAVDSAIELFSVIFPLQNAQTQETVIEQLIKCATIQGFKVSPIRKTACQINSLVAVIGSLKYIAAKKGQISSPKVLVAIRDLMSGFVKSPEPSLRSAACEMTGRITRISGNALFINPIIQDFTDQIINNRDPDVRAGSCLALGSIYHFIGGMAASSHLRTSVGLFHSLAADPHPHVNKWALHALYLTIESAGLMYGPFVSPTLTLIAKLYMSDTHEPGATAANMPGSEGNDLLYAIFGRILHALVGVIGPELQDSARLRDICFNLFEQLKNDTNPFVVVEAIKCIQNFIMFAPKYVDIPVIIPFLQKQLVEDTNTQVSVVRTAAVTCLYQLTQRDPASVLGAALNNCLEEQLFSLFDLEMDSAVRDEIKDILTGLMRHVAPQTPSRWIDLCKNILSKSSEPPRDGSAAGGPHANAPAPQEDETGEETEAAEPVAAPAKAVQKTAAPL